MRRFRSAGARGVLLVLLASGLLVLVSQSASRADGPCDRWAATGGDDGNPGTEAQPFRSIGRLVASLTAGQVGCLPAGETFYGANSAVDGGYGVANAGGGTQAEPITITSGPGAERATFKGQLQLNGPTHDIVLTDLAFAGKYYANSQKYGAKGVHLLLFGDRITVADNDISDPMGICIQVGNSDSDSPFFARSDGVVVTRNRIHGCGMDPSINWLAADSGAHGMYIQNSLGTLVSENLIYGNRTRGVQLYPLNDGVVVENNLLHGNATQVNIGSEGGQLSRNSVVRDNLMAARVTNWFPGKNESQVFGNLPTAPDLDNDVLGNCYAPGDPFIAGNNVTDAGGNVAGTPVFEGAAGGDFRLSPGSPCTGFGPASIQPPTDLGLADETVTEGTGADVTMTFTWNHPVHATAILEPGTADASDFELVGDGHLGDAGETSVSVRIVGDAVDEADETFTLTLEDFDNEGEVLGTATGTIVDDDAADPPPGDPRPDAWVATGGAAAVGDDVYNTTGAGQTVAVEVERGDTATVAITLQNDSTAADDLLAAGAPSTPHQGFSHAYLRGTTDVTAAVDGGNYSLPDVPASATRPLTFQVTPGDGTAAGETVAYFLHLYHVPSGDPVVKDVVKIVVMVVGRQHDLTVRSNAGGAVVGVGVYDDGSAQTLARRTKRGVTARFTARVVNRGSVAARVALEGGAPRRGVRGRWMLGGRNVTAGLRDGTLRTPALAPGDSLALTYVAVVGDRARTGLRARAFLTGRQSGAPSDTVRVVTVVRR